MLVECTCRECGGAFRRKASDVRQYGGRYCSRACANAAKQRQVERTCKRCGSVFAVRASSVARGFGTYCSRACYFPVRAIETARICPACGVTYTKPTVYCSSACYGQSRRGKRSGRQSTRITRTCIGCGEPFLVYPSQLKYGVGLWCSAACRYSTPGWAATLKPPSRKTSSCGICGKTFETVASRKAAYCSRECVGVANGKRMHRDPSKWTTGACVECGTAFETLICLGGRKKFCSRACNGIASARRLRILRPTSIEVALRRGLTEAGIATVPEMRVARFLIDMAIPAAKIAIEADGKYWHSLPNRVTADARKNAALAAAGWTVLRFGEDEINADVASCVAVVLEALRARAR